MWALAVWPPRPARPLCHDRRRNNVGMIELSELIDLARPWVVPAQGGSDERPDLEDGHIDRRLRE